jgi:hypothetical protein
VAGDAEQRIDLLAVGDVPDSRSHRLRRGRCGSLSRRSGSRRGRGGWFGFVPAAAGSQAEDGQENDQGQEIELTHDRKLFLSMIV